MGEVAPGPQKDITNKHIVITQELADTSGASTSELLRVSRAYFHLSFGDHAHVDVGLCGRAVTSSILFRFARPCLQPRRSPIARMYLAFFSSGPSLADTGRSCLNTFDSETKLASRPHAHAVSRRCGPKLSAWCTADYLQFEERWRRRWSRCTRARGASRRLWGSSCS